MRYVEARLDEFEREETYRIFVTTSLQLIPQNKHLVKSYTDMVMKNQNPVNNRTGDDIAMDIITRAGLTLGKGVPTDT